MERKEFLIASARAVKVIRGSDFYLCVEPDP